MNKEQFEAMLNEVYDGAVKPLISYVNDRAVLCFKCDNCGLRFFGKPYHMVGKDHQRHVCGMPYGDKNGNRLGVVPKRGDSFGAKGKKKKETIKIDQVNKMIWEDYTYQQIAKELKVNPDIVEDHFKKEGLI
jgi:hypothetical protein